MAEPNHIRQKDREDTMNEDETIIGQWFTVRLPDPPEIKKVLLEPGTTALLILDSEKRTTNMERRPRVVTSVP